MPQPAKPFLPFLYGATLFLGAGLLFVVQPMIARMILPQFGGAPAVWNTCLVFFQATLLGGYVYAHVSTVRWGVRRQAWLHLVLLCLPLLALPIAMAPGWAPQGDAAVAPRLLGLLAVSVGAPFFVVSTTAPLVQRWFVATGHAASRDPYFLYAASNAGSLLALVGYPLLVEPRLSLARQGWSWAIGYSVLGAAVFACAWTVLRPRRPAGARAAGEPGAGGRAEGGRGGRAAGTPSAAATPVTNATRLRWVALAAAPSSLLLGVTTYLTSNISPVPLLWVIPLALYLLSFILVFSRLPTWVHRTMTVALPPAALWQAFVMHPDALDAAGLPSNSQPVAALVWVFLPTYLFTFFAASMVCHGELARSRPAAERLTEFYLWMSLGGMLGGMFNALVAPLVFDHLLEFPLALAAACALAPPLWRLSRSKLARALDYALPPAVGLLAGLAFFIGYNYRWSEDWRAVPPLALCACLVRRPLRFGLALGAVLVATVYFDDTIRSVVYRKRSFFGELQVTSKVVTRTKTDDASEIPEEMQLMHLVHGTIQHGSQYHCEDPAFSNLPLDYYFPTSPIGQVFAALPGRFAEGRLGFVGLGAGSLAAYGRQGQEFTFFEIDAAVERIARNPDYFTFLRNCKARVGVVLGDARLSLAREPDGRYCLLVVDAFSGDAIPVHLLTREALELYRSKMAPGGLIAFHISNRYVKLAPVLANLAQAAGMAGIQQDDWSYGKNNEERQMGKSSSHWVLIAETPDDFRPLLDDDRWQPLPPRPDLRLWTDDFSDLLSVFFWDESR